MKRLGTMMLAGTIILVLISSCASVPKQPLGDGEMRLLGIDVPERGSLLTTVNYWLSINFESDGHVEVTRACFYWSGDGPYCYPVKNVRYGAHPSFEVPLYPREDTNRLECYAEYMRDGKKQRTNKVSISITGYTLR